MSHLPDRSGRILALCYGLFLLLAAPLHAHAQERGGQSVVQDGFEVHYAALNTMDIPPQAARALDIRRSGNRALLVLNARRLEDIGSSSVRAEASGGASNLLGQDKGLELRVVRDAEVWYVLADFRIADGEHIRFNLDIRPDNSDTTIPLRFEQTFYRER